MIAYGTCVGSWDKFTRWVVPRVGDRSLLGLAGQPSIAVAYNKIIDAHRGRNLDALVLLHDDLEILDRDDAEAKFLAALEDRTVGLVGVAGSRSVRTMHWWSADTLGHQMTDSGMLDFGERSGDAIMLEGSILVLSPVVIENLVFDTQYPGFLGYDDVCLTIDAWGFRSVVVDVDTHHHSTVGIKSESVRLDWERTEAIFNQKWHLR